MRESTAMSVGPRSGEKKVGVNVDDWWLESGLPSKSYPMVGEIPLKNPMKNPLETHGFILW
jgi:hypothetical protein